MPRPTLLQFGAGNIGRSFVAQLFSRAGYEVVFIDIEARLLEALNRHGRYRVIVKHGDRDDETLWIENVRAIDGRDTEAVVEAVAEAAIAATAVGQRALPIILKTLAAGLAERHDRHGPRPLDIIIAENLHGAAQFFRDQLAGHLPAGFPLDAMTGLVESSIGKMVPIMREEDLREDPAWVFAEPYNTLILDRHAFRNPLPAVPGLKPVDDMDAFVDRKLYIHNLGHAAAAYLGHLADPSAQCIWQVLQRDDVLTPTREAMEACAEALSRKYPNAYTREDLQEHIEDLLHRFQNRALGDTVYRVGRDLPRKLAPSDRVIGSLRLARSQDVPCDAIVRVAAAALHFRATDAEGRLFEADADFHRRLEENGIDHTLQHLCGLDPDSTQDRPLIEAIRVATEQLGPVRQ